MIEMARGPKHPGLQQKFEQLLLELLADGKPLKARQLVEGASSQAAKFGIGSDELEDLQA